jgi:hypothetical protein
MQQGLDNRSIMPMHAFFLIIEMFGNMVEVSRVGVDCGWTKPAAPCAYSPGGLGDRRVGRERVGAVSLLQMGRKGREKRVAGATLSAAIALVVSMGRLLMGSPIRLQPK